MTKSGQSGPKGTRGGCKVWVWYLGNVVCGVRWQVASGNVVRYTSMVYGKVCLLWISWVARLVPVQ